MPCLEALVKMGAQRVFRSHIGNAPAVTRHEAAPRFAGSQPWPCPGVHGTTTRGGVTSPALMSFP